MKVPTYQRQTQRTASTGARNFSVRANPGALSADIRALGGAVGVVENIGLDFYERQKSEQRDAEVTDNENKFKVFAQELLFGSKNEDPTTVLQGNRATPSFEDRLETQIQRQAAEISDTKTRKKFLTVARASALGTVISANQDARNRQIDGNKAIELERADVLINQAFNGNRYQRDTAYSELFGIGELPGLYDTMAARGLITQTQAVTYTRTARGRIASGDVQSRILDASESKKPERARQLFEQLSNTKEFPDLKPEDRDRFQRQVLRLEESLSNERVRRLEQQDRLDKNARTDRHRTNASDLHRRIISAQQNPSDAKEQAGMPTELELVQKLERDEISQDTYNNTLKILRGGEVTEDKRLIAEINADIMSAETTEEIEAVLVRLDAKQGIRIGYPKAEQLRERAALRGGKSPLSREIKRYHDTLKAQIGLTQKVTAIGLLSQEPFEIDLADDAIETYFDLTTNLGDINANLSPKAAYLQVREQFNRAQDEDLEFLVPLPFVVDYLTDEGTGLKEVKDLTLQDIIEGRERIQKNKSLSQMQRALELETLGFIAARIARKSVEPPPPPKENDQSDQGFFNFFTRSKSDDVLEEAKDR